MKRILFVLPLLLASLSTGFVTQENRFVEIKRAVVQLVIKTENPQNPYESLGSGFIVSENTIVTAAHIYFGAGMKLASAHRPLEIFALIAPPAGSTDRLLVPAVMQTVDAQHDLTVLQFNAPPNSPPVTPLVLSKRAPELGEEVFLIGFVAQDSHSVMIRGVVSGNPVGLDDILFDAQSNPGQSGGPVISKTSGEVLGVQSQTIQITVAGQPQPMNTGISRATRSAHVSRLLLPTPK